MPTFDKTVAFQRDYEKLNRQDKQQLLAALQDFIEDLEAIDAGTKSRFRRSLRVKRVHRVCSVWELTWAPDGRATFIYGKPVLEGLTHIQWRRCGSHAILRNP